MIKIEDSLYLPVVYHLHNSTLTNNAIVLLLYSKTYFIQEFKFKGISNNWNRQIIRRLYFAS